MGITFFTALWILYVPGCALSAATETDRTLKWARARVKDTLKLLLDVLRMLQNRMFGACMLARYMCIGVVINANS